MQSSNYRKKAINMQIQITIKNDREHTKITIKKMKKNMQIQVQLQI